MVLGVPILKHFRVFLGETEIKPELSANTPFICCSMKPDIHQCSR